ncbi:MAG: FtsW/RodA/SpoVE family cell cycle protein [Bacteroidales bacterium]|jgi:cell division protein FtsW|nr:FtsW/RodA/SpoVE family cell cycle protein [Bacteroidales bacterium]
MASAKNKNTFWTFADRFEGDKVVWIIVLLLTLFSIVCMFSSSSRLLRDGMTRLDLVKNQFIIVLVGLALILVCYNIKNINFFRWCSQWGFAVSLLLLALLDAHVNLPFLKALNINDAYRILSFAGFQIHVFEVVKVAMVLYLAWAMDALKRGTLKGPRKLIWKKILYLYAPFLLIFVMIIPGSNSSALIIGLLMFVMILLGGGNLKDMVFLAAAGIVILGICFALFSLTREREHPLFDRIGTGISRVLEKEDWEQQVIDNPRGTIPYQTALDAIRQPYSAKIAVKQGGLLGKGPGQSTQRYVVPDMSEDFMYSFIIEEYGLIGGIFVIFLYVSLLARASIIVRNCGSDQYAKLSVAGLCLLITGQAFLHMFVNADLGPMTGQTLPLISHGNSAFLCFSIAFGIILSFSRIAARRIDRETRAAAPLVEMHESSVQARLDDLDNYESGQMQNDLTDLDSYDL